MIHNISSLFVEDPSVLSNDELLSRIQDALHLAHKGLAYHADLGSVGMFSLGKLSSFIEDSLGWPLDRCFDLVAGSSEKTTELHRSLEKIVLQHKDELSNKELPRTWAAILTETPKLGAALHEWLKENRLRVLHYDPKHPTLGEQPELVLSIVESIIWSLNKTQEPPTNAAMQEAKAKLDSEKYAELERLVAKTRRAYALRDENGIETVSRPSGLLRWFVLELGRRIEAQIGRPEYAVYLYPEEHKDALRGSIPRLRELIEKRRGEESWAVHHRGPVRFGKTPPPMPVDAFPRAMSRFFKALDWMMKAEASREEAPAGEPLLGNGFGDKIVTAKARVIDHPSQLVSLRHGEVLVCRITSPEWAVALGRVGAIVTEEGGALSHPAIIAREFGITAVLGATNARQRISTGDLLRVDPIAGNVTKLTT